MTIAGERIRLTWDKLLTGEIEAAVATQEAAGLLPIGTSSQVPTGALSLTKTEAAAIVIARPSLGQLKVDGAEAYIVKADWEDDPPVFTINGLEGKTGEAPSHPPTDRTRDFADKIGASIFR